MIFLELFSGNGDISQSFKNAGHDIFRVDYNEKLEAELHVDINKLNVQDLVNLCGGVPDIVWASPDCTTYSIATHRHRTKLEGLVPKTEYAKECDLCNAHLWELIDELIKLGTKYYFVENPRGRYRLMPFVQGRNRHTITYCSYGRPSMKPTDIFTNHNNPDFKKACNSRNPPHKHADWGSEVKRDYLNRGKIPVELCNHIVKICEK